MTGPQSGRPRVVLVARNFPPLVGGIEAMMSQVVTALSQEYDVVLIGPAGSALHAERVRKAYQLPSSPLWFLLLGLCVVPWVALRHRPMLAVASNGLMAPLVWLLSKLHSARSLVFLHGLDIVSPHPLYRRIAWPLARSADCLSVNSTNTGRLAVRHGAPAGRIRQIPPGVRHPVQLPDSSQLGDRLNSYGAFILYAGRVVPRKGLLEFILHAHEWLRASGTHLVVAGAEPAGQAGPGAGAYLALTKRTVSDLGLQAQVHWLGRVDDEDMGLCMGRAAVHVMPLVSVEGDVEGFGMVAVEAASYGTPTVAFDCGGVSDALASREYLVPAGDYTALIASMERARNHAPDPAVLQRWARKFYLPEFRRRLMDVVSELLNDGIR